MFSLGLTKFLPLSNTNIFALPSLKLFFIERLLQMQETPMAGATFQFCRGDIHVTCKCRMLEILRYGRFIHPLFLTKQRFATSLFRRPAQSQLNQLELTAINRSISARYTSNNQLVNRFIELPFMEFSSTLSSAAAPQ